MSESETVVSKIVKQLEKGHQDTEESSTQVKNIDGNRPQPLIRVPEVVQIFQKESTPTTESEASPVLQTSKTAKLIQEYSILAVNDKPKQISKNKNDRKKGKAKKKEQDDVNQNGELNAKDVLSESSVHVYEEVDRIESKIGSKLPTEAKQKRIRRNRSSKGITQKGNSDNYQDTVKDQIIESVVNNGSTAPSEESKNIVKTDCKPSDISVVDKLKNSVEESEKNDLELNCTAVSEKQDTDNHDIVNSNVAQPEKSDTLQEQQMVAHSHENTPEPEEGTYDKVRGFIGQTIHGYLFEQKFALMLYVRGACKLYGINKFRLVTNALKAEPFDDTVFQCCFGSSEENLVFKTYFVQLKHKNDTDKQYISYEKNCKFFGDKELKSLSKLIEIKKKLSSNNPFVMFRCRPEDCEFVLYTNSGIDERVVGSFCTCPHILSSLHPASNQECTCRKNSVLSEVKSNGHGIFTFNIDSKALKEKIGAKFDSVSESISVLKVFVYQPSEENLEEVVLKDLENALHKSSEKCKIIYDMLFEQIEKWWLETNTSTILTDESNLLNNVILSHLVVLAKDDIRKSKNKFNEFHLKEIEQLLNRHQYLIIVADWSVQLSKLKILQCLETYKTTEYFPVTLTQFIRDKDILLSAWKPLDKTLMFEDDSSSEQEKEEFCQFISEVVEQNENKRFVAILQPGDILREILKQKFSCFEYIDISSYKDLHQDLRNSVLDYKVTFQGFNIDLKHLVLGEKADVEDGINIEIAEILERLVSEDIICKVLNNEETVIGKNLETVSCISRHLSRQINIKKEILDLSKHSARYAFTGTTKKELECFLNQPEQICDEIQLLNNNEPLRDKYHLFLLSAENSKQEFETLCRLYNDDNIHFFEIGEDSFVWKKSHKSKDTNICMKLLKEASSDAFLCSESEVTSSVVPVVAEPGMGKTVMLKYVAHLTKVKNPSALVIYINLNEQTKYLVDSESIDAINFLICSQCGSDQVCKLDKFLMTHILEKTKNAIVLLDGFDEVYSMYKDKVCEIIKSLINLEITQLWIASRQILQTELEEFLCSLCYVMQPLDKEEQEKLLMKYLNTGNSSKTDQEIFTSNLNELTKKYLDDNRQFMGNPQHLEMLAYILQQKGKIQEIDQITLYKTYVDLKFDKCNREKADLDVSRPATRKYIDSFEKNFMEYHEKLAISATLQHGDFNIPTTSEVNTMFQNVKMAGIVIDLKEDGKPRFINEKLAIYFAAKWLSDNYANQKDFLKEKFFDNYYITMRQVFDLILAETYECHKSIVLRKDVEKSILSDSALKDDRGQRIPLHLAAAYNNSDIIEELMTVENKKKQQLQFKDKILNWTPVEYAKNTHSYKAEDRLLAYGAKPTNVENNNDALKRAINEDCPNLVVVLLMQKELRTSTDDSGNTALHLAAWRGEYGMVKLILKTLKKEEGSGLRIVKKIPSDFMNACNKDDNTPLHMAAIGNNHCKVLNLLIKEGSDPKRVNSQGNNIIHLAVWQGHSETVSELSDKHKSLINQQNSQGNTPLGLGVISANTESVEVLVKKGADISIANNEGQSALNLSVEADSPQIVGILLKSETSGFKVDINECMTEAVLHGNLQVCKELLNNGADLNKQNNSGETELHVAVKQDDLEIVKFLVEAGVNKKIRNKRGNTPLHEAIELNRTEIVDFLYDDSISEDLFYEAIGNGKIKMVEFLVKKGLDINFSNAKGDTPLHIAVKNNRKDVLEYLISLGAFVNAQDFKMNTPLHVAISEGRKDLVELLLKQGANLSKQNYNGNAPIHEAVKHGRREIADILLDKGVDKNMQNRYGMTPLHVAVCNNNMAEIELLLNNGADFRILNDDGNSPLHEAFYQYDFKLAKFLIQRGVDVGTQDKDGNTALHALAEIPFDQELTELCLSYKDYIMVPNNQGNTPLNRAVSWNNKELFDFLVKNGADPRKGFRGFNALHAAVHSGNLEFTKYLIKKYSVDVNICEDLRKETALHIGVKEQQLEIIEYLIEKGARIDICNQDSMTPEMLAQERGLEEIETYLRNISQRKK